jgi:hypothetical protein
MIIGMDLFTPPRLTKQLQCTVGDNLVGIHVGRCPGPGLKNVHDEFVSEFSLHDLRGRLAYGPGKLGVEQSQLLVDGGRGIFD